MGRHSKNVPDKKIKLPKISLKLPQLKKSEETAESEDVEKKEKAPRPSLKVNENVKALSTNATLTIGRLVIAALILVLISVSELPNYLIVLLSIVAVLTAGFKIGLNLVEDVDQGHYVTINLIIVLCAVASFFMGFTAETVIMIIVYEAAGSILPVVFVKTRETAESTLDEVDPAIAAQVREAIKEGSYDFPEYKSMIEGAARNILLIASGVAILTAVLLPIFMNCTIAEAIHRAFMVLVVTTPVSVIAAIPAVGVNGMCYAAAQGFTFKKANTFLTADQVKTVVMDKTGVITNSSPALVSIEPSHRLDQLNYLTFAAHAVYYSKQSQFKALQEVYNFDYRTELISDFKDIHGYGVSLKIGGNEVLFGTSDLFNSTDIAFKPYEKGIRYFYMTIAGQYAGCIGFSDGINSETYSMLSEIRSEGAEYFVLLSEDGEEDNEVFSQYDDFNKVYHGLNLEGKISIIQEMMTTNQDVSAFIYANGIEGHSDCTLDIRVNNKGNYADILIDPAKVGSTAKVFSISRHVRSMLGQNAIIAFAIKSLAICLALSGFCTLWIAVLLDNIAGLVTIINSTRVASEPKERKAPVKEAE